MTGMGALTLADYLIAHSQHEYGEVKKPLGGMTEVCKKDQQKITKRPEGILWRAKTGAGVGRAAGVGGGGGRARIVRRRLWRAAEAGGLGVGRRPMQPRRSRAHRPALPHRR